MSNHTAAEPRLYAVTEEETEVLALRAEALRRFTARYRHNPESQRAMVGALRRLSTTFSRGCYDERTFPWEMLVDEDLTALMCAQAAEGYARNTAVKDASALRVMLGCCHRVGLLSYEEYQHARNLDVTWGEHRPPAGQFLSERDVELIVRSCARTAVAPNTRTRDTAMVMTLASTGARGWELMGALVENTDLPAQRIWLHRTKSGTPRDAWLHPEAAASISRWLDVRGRAPGPLFVPLSRTGRPLHERGELSTHQARRIVRRGAAAAGLDGVALHDLRRFVISSMLDHGVDLALVARVVGHMKPETTAGYDRRPAQKLRDAVACLELPRLAS